MAQNVSFSLNSQAATSIGTAAGVIANVVNQYIVSANNAPPGISGFVFDIVDDEEAFLDSEITDSWLETNSAIQDHIALKPITYRLRGFVGELNDIFQIETASILGSVTALLPAAGLLPNWNTQDAGVYTTLANVSTQAQSVVSQVTSIASLIGQLTGALTRQQTAYNILFNFRMNRVLCTIQTPYGLLTNMAIESIRPLQSGYSNQVSDFSVSFKQIQQVGTSVTATTGNPNPSGSATQSSPQQALNPTTGMVNTPGITPNAPPNFPSTIQSGITGSTSAGYLADATAPLSLTPGANNGGVENYPNTQIPVSTATTFTQNPVFTQTLPQPLTIPTPRTSVPMLPLPGVP